MKFKKEHISRELNLPRQAHFFLFGPRQVGKSTWIRKNFLPEETLYFDLLLSDTYMRLKVDPSLFRQEIQARANRYLYVVVDEIQRIPELLNEIHYLIENEPNTPFFILTGSSARKLKRAKANLLAGRAWTLHLHPLTPTEIMASSYPFILNKALSRGSLPAAYLQSDELSTQQLLKSYVETYLKEEIEAEALVRSSGTFLRFLFQAGHENGQSLNFSNIAREVGCSHTTVKEYFQILEDTLVGTMIFPYQKSLRKRLSQHPKFYFFDTGVVRALTKKLSVPLEPQTPEYGRYFEQWIINETIKINDYHNKDWTLSYIRTESGTEIDLIIETPNGKTIAVEIKSTQTPFEGSLKKNLSLADSLPNPHKICVCTAQNPRKIDGIHLLPWKEYLDFLIDLQ